MKKAAIITLLLIALIACGMPETQETQDTEQILETSEEPISDAMPATETQTEPQMIDEVTEETQSIETTEPPETTETTQPEQINTTEYAEEIVNPAQQRTKMYQFLDTYAQKVKSYEFEYKRDKYAVKSQRFRIRLAAPVIVKDITFGDVRKSLFYYDTVYVDRADKTAIAYCEGHTSQVNTQCAQLEIYDLPYPVNYQDYNILLPEDWLFEYLNMEPDQWETNKYYIEGRAATTVKFNEQELELNFDPGTGLVLRVDQKKGNQLLSRHDYEKLASNLVRDVDVKHRSKNEIPSSETFYSTK